MTWCRAATATTRSSATSAATRCSAARGDDLFLGGNPNGAPDPGTSDTCHGQQGTDFAVVDTCEMLGQMEGEIPFPEG